MSGPLGHAQLLSPGVLPDLSDSKLFLANTKGSLSVIFSPSKSNFYQFMISRGTRKFVTADGTTGNAVLANGPHAYQIRFESDNHRSKRHGGSKGHPWDSRPVMQAPREMPAARLSSTSAE